MKTRFNDLTPDDFVLIGIVVESGIREAFRFYHGFNFRRDMPQIISDAIDINLKKNLVKIKIQLESEEFEKLHDFLYQKINDRVLNYYAISLD